MRFGEWIHGQLRGYHMEINWEKLKMKLEKAAG